MEVAQEAFINDFQQALLRASRPDAERILMHLREENIFSVRVEAVVVAALERIGRDWEIGKAALSQVYMSGKICEELMKSLPSDAASQVRTPGRCAIALLNDYHGLGKRIVLSALRSAGFDIQDWGRMTQEQLIAKVAESEIDVLLLSTLMLPSALLVREVKEQLDAQGFEGKLLVGGAPFRLDKQLWKEVGADATAVNAMDAIKVLSALLGRE